MKPGDEIVLEEVEAAAARGERGASEMLDILLAEEEETGTLSEISVIAAWRFTKGRES